MNRFCGIDVYLYLKLVPLVNGIRQGHIAYINFFFHIAVIFDHLQFHICTCKRRSQFLHTALIFRTICQ